MSGKAIRETIGFIGVVASLVFVGFEVRQNTVSARAAAYQEMGSTIAGVWLLGAQNPELAILTLRFFEEEDAEFTPVEEAVLVAQTVGAFRQYETVWRQVRLGLLEPEVLQYFGWGGDVVTGNLQRLWSRIRQRMSPDFLRFLEESAS